MEIQKLLRIREAHERMGKALEKEMEKLQASASRADTPEKRNRVKRWQIGLQQRIDYYNSMDDLLEPDSLEALASAKERSNAIEHNSLEQLEERNNFLRWKLESSAKEIQALKKKWIISKKLLEDHTEINPSLVSWMQFEDVGLNYLKTA